MNVEHKIMNSIPIHYYVSGENDHSCILFVHPAFADHRAFDKQVEFFSKKHKIITIDLLGHGQSQDIKTGGGIDNSAAHIMEILEIEGIEKLHLVGVSIGSLLLQDFANKYPDKVLSLCSIGGYDINHYDKGIEKEQGKQQLLFMVKALISIKWFSKSNSLITAMTEDAQKDFYEMNKLFKRRSFRYMATLGKIMNQFQTQRNYPLLLLCGDSDNELAIKLSKKWNEFEKKSVFSTISKAGHCANMDNPVEFNTVLIKFLDNCAANGKRGGDRVSKEKWVLCPVCKNKTRDRIREDTVLKNFPLFCPKCKQETIINVEQMNITIIKEPDAMTQSR